MLFHSKVNTDTKKTIDYKNEPQLWTKSWTKKKQNVKLMKIINSTYHICHMHIMLISFFFQTSTQTNEKNHRASQNMLKVSNKITRKTYGSSHINLKKASYRS